MIIFRAAAVSLSVFLFFAGAETVLGQSSESKSTTDAQKLVVPKEAPCQICLWNGEGMEKVKAHSILDDVLYTFCSKACKETFDADPVGYVPPVYPMAAPALKLQSIDGQPMDINGDRWMLVDFWATWCQPCIKLMPEVEKLSKEFGPRGLEVVGVSVDEDGKKAKKFAEKHKVSYPVALDATEDPAWGAFNVKVIPTVFLIDPDGQIQARWVGIWEYDTVAETLSQMLPQIQE